MHLTEIYEAVLEGDAQAAASKASAALEAGVGPKEILQEACTPAMDEVGRLFESGEVFVPEMLLSARAMQAVVNLLRPLLVDTEVESLGTVVLGTVAGDMHDLGKNLVGMMLEGAGFKVVDLGTNVPAQAFVEAVQEHEAAIVGMSALLTTTVTGIAQTISALEEAGIRTQVKVMIGGAPVSADFAEKIGADGYGADAGAAVRVARTLVGAGA